MLQSRVARYFKGHSSEERLRIEKVHSKCIFPPVKQKYSNPFFHTHRCSWFLGRFFFGHFVSFEVNLVKVYLQKSTAAIRKICATEIDAIPPAASSMFFLLPLLCRKYVQVLVLFRSGGIFSNFRAKLLILFQFVASSSIGKRIRIEAIEFFCQYKSNSEFLY